MSSTRIISFVIIILMLGTPAFGDEISPNEILKKVAATYKSMKTYKAQGIITSDFSFGGGKKKTSFSILLKKPNLYLISWTRKNEPVHAKDTSGAIWSEGAHLYMYVGMIKAYSSMADESMALGFARAISDWATYTIPSLFLSSLDMPTDPMSRLKDAKLELSEIVEGEDCYVIVGSSARTKMETFWISKTSSLIRKYRRSYEKGSYTELYATISSPELNESDFKYSLPEGTVLKDSLFGELLDGKEDITIECLKLFKP